MIQTKATGHAGNKRRSDSAVAQQLTPANTRKRAAKTKRLNLFCSIISKQNEVSKTIQINQRLTTRKQHHKPNSSAGDFPSNQQHSASLLRTSPVIYLQNTPPAATLLEQPLSTLSHHRTLSGKQQKVEVNSTILPLFPHTPNDDSPHIKRKTKIKAPDRENGHTATASRIILKNETHVPHVSYI